MLIGVLLVLVTNNVFAKDGRFTVTFYPAIRADSVLLDTHNGKIGRRHVSSKTEKDDARFPHLLNRRF